MLLIRSMPELIEANRYLADLEKEIRSTELFLKGWSIYLSKVAEMNMKVKVEGENARQHLINLKMEKTKQEEAIKDFRGFRT